MLQLCGFPLSNYHNKVKMALLEKGLPFEEVPVGAGLAEIDLLASPLGKVPYLVTEHGSLCESQVMVDYIEARWPTPALVPADPWAAAKVREIATFMDLHVELCARQLYPQAFFGGTLPESFIARVRPQLERLLVAFKHKAAMAPFAAGDTFTLADCSVYPSLPLAALASKLVYGVDLVVEAGIDWKGYVKMIDARPSAQKVSADRKADQARALAAQAAKVAAASRG